MSDSSQIKNVLVNVLSYNRFLKSLFCLTRLESDKSCRIRWNSYTLFQGQCCSFSSYRYISRELVTEYWICSRRKEKGPSCKPGGRENMDNKRPCNLHTARVIKSSGEDCKLPLNFYYPFKFYLNGIRSVSGQSIRVFFFYFFFFLLHILILYLLYITSVTYKNYIIYITGYLLC